MKDELRLCLACSDAMDAMVQAAAVIGDQPGVLPGSCLHDLCRDCSYGFWVLLEEQAR